MHVEGEPIIALCYINREGDADNACYLSKQTLFVRYKKRLNSFNLENIRGITFEHKLLLLPLVVGGIITPLSIHGLLHTFINGWFLLIGMVAGLLLMYLGWEGSSTMTIQTAIKDYDFFIRQPSSNLKAFAEYVQHYISDHEKGRKFYFTKERSEWEKVKHYNLLKVEEPLHLYTWNELSTLKPEAEKILLAIDPIEDNIEISFLQVSGKQKLQPVIKHNIPTAYIHELTYQV